MRQIRAMQLWADGGKRPAGLPAKGWKVAIFNPPHTSHPLIFLLPQNIPHHCDVYKAE